MTDEVLAIWMAPRWEPAAGFEFLRIVTALVACGGDVKLAQAGEGRGVLTSGDLPEEAERYLAGLARSAIAIEELEEDELARLLPTCAAIVRVGSPDRDGTPPVLAIGSLDAKPPRVQQAGQVVCSL